MNRFVFIILFLSQNLIFAQQNLVVNGGFETYTSCPTKPDQIHYAEDWCKVLNTSPDYFNSCSQNIGITTPKNSIGYQIPKSGNAYGGAYFFFYSIPNARELIVNKLSQKLKANQLYEINYYVSLSDSSLYGINNIGAILGDRIPKDYRKIQSNYNGTEVILDSNNVITNKNDWVLISGHFIAKGDESYLIIGNYKNDLQTKYKLTQNGFVTAAYYYIDDVSLYEVTYSYDISLDSIQFFAPCYDSLKVKITNSGDSAIDFTVHPDTLDLELKQNGNVVQSLQKIIKNNQLNSNGLPLKKDSSFWVTFAPLNYSGNSSNYTVSVNAKMAADSFLLDNFIEVPALSVGSVSISNNILCQGDSVSLYSQKVLGDAIWQFSKDKQSWQNIGSVDTLVHYPTTKGYYRLAICNKVYSDTLTVDLDKKDISLEGLFFTNPCYDSIAVKIVNRGCFALDFSQNTLNLFFNFNFNGQQLLQNKMAINTNEQNPLKKPLEADSSLIIYFSPLSYSAGQGNYFVSVQATMLADGFFKNNYIDSTFNPSFSVGNVAIDTNEICAGDSIVLYSEFASESAVWQFKNNKQNWQNLGFADTLVYYPKESGFFRLAVCGSYSDTLEIKVNPMPPVINQEFQFCSPWQHLLQLDSNSAISTINWYKTAKNGLPFHQGFTYKTTINESISYYLESVNNKCVSKERGILKITIGGCTLEIPNIFTPNGDGINDLFEYGQAFGKEIKTSIYNRWGKKVEEFTGNEGWSGKGYPAGTYFYVIEADGEVYRGSVMLIR